MTTPTAQIQASDVNVEVGRAWNAAFNMGDSAVRNLAKVPSGTISMADLRGKSSYTPMSATSTGIYYRDASATTTVQTYSATGSINLYGGVGPYSYQWAWQDAGSGGLTLNNSTSAYCTVSYRVREGTASGTLQCTVRDSLGYTYTLYNIPVEFVIGREI